MKSRPFQAIRYATWCSNLKITTEREGLLVIIGQEGQLSGQYIEFGHDDARKLIRQFGAQAVSDLIGRECRAYFFDGELTSIAPQETQAQRDAWDEAS